jgi:hypothetical protein
MSAKYDGEWRCSLRLVSGKPVLFAEDTEAEARSKMLVYVLEKKLI